MIDRREFMKAGVATTALASAAPQASANPGSAASAPVRSAGLNDTRRFLDQATMGARPGEAAAFSTSFSEWLAAQFAVPFRPIDAARMYSMGYDNSNVRNNATRLSVFARWCSEPGQLRMRVSHVLQQIVCCGPSQWSAEMDSALWWNGIAARAFGNYRDILKWAITHRHMGAYLNNKDNNASGGKAPSQNFARELLQLFSMGPAMLNQDGSMVLDQAGKPRQAYFQQDVDALARLLSGWGLPFANNVAGFDSTFPDGTMNVMPALAYSGPDVSFLGTVFPAVSRPLASTVVSRLNACLDLIMAQPTTAAYISRQFIQKMVTDTPSPAYVSAVTAVFLNNGAGVRGDLRSLVRAVLLHPEARGNAKPLSYGRSQEWTLSVTRAMRYAELEVLPDPVPTDVRAWGWSTDHGNPVMNLLGEMGQAPNTPASVFNDYPFDHRLNRVEAPASALWRAPALMANIARMLSYTPRMTQPVASVRNDMTGRWSLAWLQAEYAKVESATVGTAQQKLTAAVTALVDQINADLNQGRAMDPDARRQTIDMAVIDCAGLPTRERLAWIVNFIRCLPESAVVV
jgi:hypothetical protein